MPDRWIVFALAGERLAVPHSAVELIAPPPALSRIPHAPPSVLGAGNLGGHIVPLLDPAPLIGRNPRPRQYDGSGEILRLRAADGRVGLWIDRVEGLASLAADLSTTSISQEIRAGAIADGENVVTLLDPTALVTAGLAPPVLGVAARGALGDIANMAAPGAVSAIGDPHLLVEAAGRRFELAWESVVEIVGSIAWAGVPRAPHGFLGIAILRGAALPLLSLAALLDSPEPAGAGSFVVAAIDRHRFLLAVDRVVGMRSRRLPSERGWIDRVAAAIDQPVEDADAIDLATRITEELRDIILGFPESDDTADPGASHDEAAQYLVLAVGGQDFAVSIASVDRVVGRQPLIRLPKAQSGGGTGVELAGAIELRGQIIPVAALHARIAGAANAEPEADPGAFAILRGPDGLYAVGADRIDRLISLAVDDITPLPGEDALIAAVAVRRGGRDLLRILAPERLWGE